MIIIDDQKKASAFIRSIIPPEVFKTQRGDDAKPVSVFVQNVIDKENEKLPESMKKDFLKNILNEDSEKLPESRKREVMQPQLKMKLK